MKGKWLLQLSSKSLLSMNIQVMPHARSHAAVAMAERVAASGIGSLRKTDGLCLCAELPRHPLDHDGGPCAAEAGRPAHSRPSALQAYLKPPRASAPSGALCTVSNPHARCEVRVPDLRALSIAIGQHSGWDSYASPRVHLHEATRTDEVQMGSRADRAGARQRRGCSRAAAARMGTRRNRQVKNVLNNGRRKSHRVRGSIGLRGQAGISEPLLVRSQRPAAQRSNP